MKWTRIEKPFPLPAPVRDAVQRLTEAGHVAYVVGGCVRDFLLGRRTKDYDLATDASPDAICALFPNSITIGKAFGVVKVPISEGGDTGLLEIATFRRDLEYKDSRHPQRVEFAGPLEDALRRDFTINAFFYDPKTSRIMDAVDGMGDLKRGVIRAIGDPALRFQEDALRLLRAIRFSCTLGFGIESGTWEATRTRARAVTRISPERIRDELNLMWSGPRPDEALRLLYDSGLLHHIIPELVALRGIEQTPFYRSQGDVWGHTLKLLQILARFYPVRSRVLSWGVLLHEVGKPVSNRKNGGMNFNGYELEGSKIAGSIAARLRMTTTESEAIQSVIGDHLKFRDLFKMRESRVERLIREPHIEDLLALHHVEAIGTDGNLAYFEYAKSRYERMRLAPPGLPRLIDGNDLIQMGFQPGPEFSSILRTVEDLALEHELSTKEEALEYVVRHFVR